MTNTSIIIKRLFFTCFIVIAWIILFYLLNFFYSEVNFWAIMLIGASIITFFGLLGLPGGITTNGTLVEAKIRFAITGSLVIVYLVYFGSVVYLHKDAQNEDDLTIGSFASTMIPTLSNLLMVVVSFYFGSTAAIEIANTVSKNGGKVQNGEKEKDDTLQ